MDSHSTDKIEETPVKETAEEIAGLYSWATLHGSKYRDFSASRREYRAQLRHRAAQQVRDQALLAQAEAEAAAEAAERIEREAVEAVRAYRNTDSPASVQQALRKAEDAARLAVDERVEAARRAEVAAVAEAAARREEREIAEAHASAQRQAARYAGSEIRRRANAISQTGPSYSAGQTATSSISQSKLHHQTSSQPEQYGGPMSHQEVASMEEQYSDSDLSQTELTDPSPQAEEQKQSGPHLETPLSPVSRQPDSTSIAPPPYSIARAVTPFSQALVPSDSTRGRRAKDEFDYQSERDKRSAPEADSESSVLGPNPGFLADQAGPAWLYAAPTPVTSQTPVTFQPPPPQSSVADTLQHSRERVAARWFALKGVFEPGQELPEATPVRQKETRPPVLAVFSLAGGVGKTSLVATVGRSLSSMGEKVLLTDTTSHGLLPFYFGASELRPGTVRTFSPPSGSTDAPIYLVSYDVERAGHDDAARELLAEEILNSSRGTHRILLDLASSSSWIVRRLFHMNPTILVPVAPDMNSVISLQSVEKFFHDINDGNGRPLQPFYLLNQFDTSLPLHLDVREVLRRQLGERLLPFVIRRAPAVSEALAEGMTVIDYAADSPVAEDYLNVANWLRAVAAPATAGFRNVRWSER